jgi:NAD(P)-dependent dehydrogenase (short-subunit alcohol dehydrogenase family)
MTRSRLPIRFPIPCPKAWVSQLTKVMALSLAPHGIRVNAVGPGSIMTDLLASVADNPEVPKLASCHVRRLGVSENRRKSPQ